MATVRQWIGTRRNKLLVLAAVAGLIVSGVGAYFVWRGWPADKPAERRSPRPTALPPERKLESAQPLAVPSSPTREGAVVNNAGDTNPGGPDAKVLGAQGGGTAQNGSKPEGASPAAQDVAKPIVVESRGRAVTLDVQSVMAMQRERAERRLYDKVLALSAGGRGSAASGISLPPGPINVPPTSSDESALGILAGRHPVERVPSGVPQQTASDSGQAAVGAGSAAAAPVQVERSAIRLVSVYARGELLMAEMVLPSGRRLDLEANDELMGYRVVRVDEGGLTLVGWPGRTGSVFVPVGKSLFQ